MVIDNIFKHSYIVIVIIILCKVLQREINDLIVAMDLAEILTNEIKQMRQNIDVIFSNIFDFKKKI